MTAVQWPGVVETASAEEKEYALDRAINGLRDEHPLQSASHAVFGWQKPVLIGLLVALAGFAAWQPMNTAVALIGLCTLGYVLTMTDRVLIFKEGLASRPITISDEAARAIPDDDLPRYTILVPAYNEPEVVGDLIAAMSALEYPRDKLQILLLLEADDDVTIEAARACGESEAITIVLVPPAEPRTKPKACNYGLHFSTGEIITIYDAEDLPEPLQLRRVAVAFRELPDDIACVQAKLQYHNGHQNILTGWFTAEYGLWFGYLLPGMMNSTSPIPLGGTSNHLRRDVLDKIGSWDPFNVTEDADLGLRIDASGYHTAVIDSATLEEANSDPINWIRQRSRWYKGYLQTWLVHIRQPVKLFRTLGPRSFLRFNLVLAGTPDHRGAQPRLLVHHDVVVPRSACGGGCGIPLVHLLSGADRAGARERRDALHEPDRAARGRPLRSAGGGSDGACVLADDERRRGQGPLSADPQSLVLGEDISRPGDPAGRP